MAQWVVIFTLDVEVMRQAGIELFSKSQAPWKKVGINSSKISAWIIDEVSAYKLY